jgi:D-lactate dehydrogenase
MSIKMIVFDFRGSEQEFFRRNKLDNFEITFVSESLNDETVQNLPVEVIDSTQVISVFIESEVTSHVLSHFKNLRVVSTRSTGIDHINLHGCRRRNIAVVNVENYGSTSVAQYAVGLIIALVRNIVPASRYITNEKECREFTGRDLSKMSIGIVGTGATGAAVAKICQALGMKVFGFDPVEKKELEFRYTDFESLVRKSDIVTLHLPYTGNNLHMFSKREFDMMRRDAYFINTSRGELVNTVDLYDVLKSGHLKGAALDVLTCESYSFACNKLAQNEPSQSCVIEVEAAQKLAQLSNVIITPHIAYETQDSINYILEETFTGIMDFISGGSSHRVV